MKRACTCLIVALAAWAVVLIAPAPARAELPEWVVPAHVHRSRRRLDQLIPTHLGGPERESGTGRLLGVHVRQLHSHLPLPEGLARAMRPTAW